MRQADGSAPRYRMLFGMLGCAMAAYIIPVLLGYGWSALNPQTPQMVGSPAAYSRPVAGGISVEHFGTGVIEVGLSARINDFVSNGFLPLWNPRQGLGQQFAAIVAVRRWATRFHAEVTATPGIPGVLTSLS